MIFTFQSVHCLLNVNPSAIEKLQRQQIYPIVIFARHKSYKSLRYKVSSFPNRNFSGGFRCNILQNSVIFVSEENQVYFKNYIH